MADFDRPNLFSYATSELSQDAFICWLAAWADHKWQSTDPALHQTARAFVVSMIQKVKPDYDPANIKTVNVRRQFEKLDVLIEINGAQPDKLAILVEDKTHTNNHSDQLNRYYQQVRTYGYDVSQMIPLYFKTGYQSKFDIGDFKTYLRSDFLQILRKGKVANVDNAIFNDFLSHLEKIDAAIRQFSAKELEKWEDDDWRGFFMVLYDSRDQLYEVSENDGANWGYVANHSGGFFGYWWYFMELTNKPYKPYLQLEQDTLCFKIEMVDKESDQDRRNAREEACKQTQQAASQLGVNVIRPNRMGNGKYMTVARWAEDYRVVNGGTLDLGATLMKPRKAQEVLDLAFAHE